MRRAAALLLVLASCGGSGMEPRVAPSSPASTITPAPPSSPASASPVPTATPSGRPAPDFTLARLADGGSFRLSDFRDQIPVALNFWAPW